MPNRELDYIDFSYERTVYYYIDLKKAHFLVNIDG